MWASDGKSVVAWKISVVAWLQDNRCMFDDWLMPNRDLIEALIEGAEVCLEVEGEEEKRKHGGYSNKNMRRGIRQISDKIEHELDF